jgi:hypothetical protein
MVKNLVKLTKENLAAVDKTTEKEAMYDVWSM